VQEVLLRVHRGLDGLKGQSAPGPWIYSITRNAIVDHWRRKGRAPTVPVDDVDVTGGELAVLDDDGESLQQAVAAGTIAAGIGALRA
jgi:RNA polymerase sigma-70 factor, ECF subfamily